MQIGWQLHHTWGRGGRVWGLLYSGLLLLLDAEVIAIFWDGIWGVEGDADPQNPYLSDWEEAVSCQVEASALDAVPRGMARLLAAEKQSP